ncbi:hypothetical protein [Streptomyces ortus]|uniref:DUF3102 domain-containing protein n=1 Tax=Streptomyces ortus TaxID=2867268 RepID=A0ABT3V0B3_9ACTN|nr:hypothetical protein [Streptomyces ortus]MCX4231733.1 hypothetical protein [Streptomyces ortus]
MSNNKLIKAGTSRLRKAADAAVDPAVPAELQSRAPEKATQQSADALPVLAAASSAFAGARVLSADDVQGTPEEQLAYVTDRLVEIDNLGRRAEDFMVLNKGVLLEIAQERGLHKVAGHSNFAQWAGGVLDIEEKYVFELLQDAARIRAVSELGTDLAQHLTKASTRKVMADVITNHGLETAQVVMTESLAEASKLGKKRPTAALLTQTARELTAPAIPSQNVGSEISDPTPSAPAAVTTSGLERTAAVVRERVYTMLAPSAVKTAAEADPVAVGAQLDELDAELQRVAKRLAAARRTVVAELEKQPVDAEILDVDQNA